MTYTRHTVTPPKAPRKPPPGHEVIGFVTDPLGTDLSCACGWTGSSTEYEQHINAIQEKK